MLNLDAKKTALVVIDLQEGILPFAGGPHIFNLGHGITPDANPDNVALMIETLREPR